MAGENGGLISGGYNPLEAPDAPTSVSGSAGDALIDVSFTAPSDVGGAAIDTYIAVAVNTSTDESTAAEGASSPITVSSLTNDVAHAISVYAKNTYGYSPAGTGDNVTPTVAIGDAYEGGFFAGQINDGGTTYNLVVAPKSSGENSSKQWKTSNTTTSGTTSTTDGPSNTSAMISAGAAAHPAADFCNDLSIGGFTDWYMPAKDELEVLYYNLKPTTDSNDTGSGTNTNAVPPRNSNYTSGDPAQTSVTDFQTGNTEAFASEFYWQSTEFSSANAFIKTFTGGNQLNTIKDVSRYVRAVRRVEA